MTRLEVRLLGPFLATLDGAPVVGFESEKVRALLAYLIFEPAEVHQRDKLAGMLWADMPDARARSNLSQALYGLRQLLEDPDSSEPLLLRSRDTVRINPQGNFSVDAILFSRLIEEVVRHGHDPAALCDLCIEKLQQAIALYRGDFLEGLSCGAGLPVEEWCITRRARFNRLALEALHQLTTCFERQGEIRKALDYAWMQVDLDSLLEPAHRQLMRLLAASDQRNLALSQFKHLERILAEELGVKPESETVELYDLLRSTAAGERQSAAAHNLPAPLTPFIGRAVELEQLGRQLGEPNCRMLTILGPGGSGKTRLALEAARRFLPYCRHGVYFIPLNALQSHAAILPAVIKATGCPIQESGDAWLQLANFLRDKQILLLLDGFEHLLDGAGLVAEILHAAPKVKILVTSRARLNIKGEHTYLLMGLQYPHQAAEESEILASEAVQLFIDGARRIRPDLKPQPEELNAIMHVCEKVEGMPLGILLASSWVASIGVVQVPVEIERSLDFLSSEWADIPLRQRSLRATYDHSWNLLSPGEQEILKSLSVFRDGFSQSAARAVASVSSHGLRALVNKSLLLRKSTGRYGMHELLCQYSAQKHAALAEDLQAAYERHARYYASLLEKWAPLLKSPQQETALGEMDIELENIRLAWNWAAQLGITPLLSRMVETLCLYYSLRMRYPEGEFACRFALEKLDAFIPVHEEFQTRLQILIWQSHFNRLLGKKDLAERQRSESQDVLGDAAHPLADIRFEQALLSYELGETIKESDFTAARGHFLHCVALFQMVDELWWATRAMLELAVCHTQIGDFSAANSWLEQCLAGLPEHGDRRSLAKALRWKGFLQVRQGMVEQAVNSMRQAAEVYRSIGDKINIADSMSGLGLILLWSGRLAESLDLVAASLQIYQELGDRYHTAFIYLIQGIGLAFIGNYPAAVESLQESIAHAREFEFRRVLAGSLLTLGWIAMVNGDLAAAFELIQHSVSEYRQVQQLDELGWALATWGQVQLFQGEHRAALASIREALQIGVDTRSAMTIYQALGPSAVWYGKQAKPERAVELYALTRNQPGLANCRWFEDIYGRQVAELADGLPAEAAAAAQARGRALDLWETARELIQEFS